MQVSTAPRRHGYRCEVVDVQAELRYWRTEIQQHGFYQPGTPFSRYEPLLRFAYDAYLRYYAQPLDEVSESIQAKYAQVFDAWHGLPWVQAECLLREVWIRMGAPTGVMRAGWVSARREVALR